jgi:hypothetical protein
MIVAPVDWQQVVLDLRNNYKALSTISFELNIEKAHLRRLARGETNEPRFNSGVKLLSLHKRACPHLHTLDHIGLVEIPTP